jgi:hypothetical protein
VDFDRALFSVEGGYSLRASLISGVIYLALIVTPAVFGQSVEISIPDAEGPAGDTVDVPINISNVTGLNVIAVEVIIQYNSLVLSAVGANTSGTIAASWQVVPNTTIPGQIAISMIWNGTDALSGSGALVNIEFLVKPSVPTGFTSQLHFTKARLNEGTPGSVGLDGVFTVGGSSEPPRLEGDVNGDDRVDHRDLLKLVLTYNKNSGDQGYDLWADLNGDGRIDKDDVIIVWRNFGTVR